MKHSIQNQVFLIPESGIDDINIVGLGQKKLVIVTESISFSDMEKGVLDKMMTAIKYNPETDLVRIELPANKSVVLSMMVEKYTDLILFGVEPARLGLNIDYLMNEILHFDNSRLLVCESIKDIIAVQQKKQILWTKLQEMFLK